MHLIRRFFGFLFAEPLTPHEQQHVRDVLSPALARAFFAQRPEDQRHAYDVQQRIGARGDLAEAALLHDVGKTESHLGAVSRSLATLWDGFGLTTSGSWKSYLNHGPIGCDILSDLGASDLAVAFSLHHPGEPPSRVDPDDWRLLEAADEA